MTCELGDLDAQDVIVTMFPTSTKTLVVTDILTTVFFHSGIPLLVVFC